MHRWIVLISLSACASLPGPQAPVATAVAKRVASVESVSAQDQIAEEHQTYLEAFEEAHSTYRAQIDRALSLAYHSDAEAAAVVRSLSGARFDALLDTSLARRGRSTAELANYLASDPALFSMLRARYHGSVGRAEAELGQIHSLVRPSGSEHAVSF
ncbi:MAG: hypothetical protein AAGF12_06735 [Myxococcota bacterium]